MGTTLGTMSSAEFWVAIASGSGSAVSITLRHCRRIGDSSQGVSALWDAAGDWSEVGTGEENGGSGTWATGVRTGVGGWGGSGGGGSDALRARSVLSGTCPGSTGSSMPALSLFST
jgi:hypothetical protein